MIKDPEKRKEVNKKWKEENKEKVKEYLKEYSKIYREKNKEKSREKSQEWYKNNKEKVKEYKDKNKEKVKENNKKWFENNKEHTKEYCNTEKYKIRKTNARHTRRSIVKSGEKVTNEMLQDLIKSQDYKCNECSVFLDFKIKFFVHLDHIIPISKGGEHKISNLQYLCRTCNLQKSNKI